MADNKNSEGYFLTTLHSIKCDVLIGKALENVFVVNDWS